MLALSVRKIRVALAIAGATLFVVGAALSWRTVSAIETTETTRTENAWREEARFEYRVPVERSVGGYEQGEVLGMGEPGYLTNASPRFPLNFSWRIAEPAGTLADGTVTITVEARGRTAAGETAWEIVRPIASSDFTDASGVDVPAVVDLESLLEEIRATEERSGRRAERESWVVVANLRFDAALPFGPVNATKSPSFQILIDAPVYVLPTAQALVFPEAHGDVVRTVYAERAGSAALARAPWPLALAAAGLAFLVTALALAERAVVEAIRIRAAGGASDPGVERRFLTTVEGPLTPPDGLPLIEASGLEELVRLARASGKRILHDASRGAFIVTGEEAWWFVRGPRAQGRRAPLVLAEDRRVPKKDAKLRPVRQPF